MCEITQCPKNESCKKSETQSAKQNRHIPLQGTTSQRAHPLLGIDLFREATKMMGENILLSHRDSYICSIHGRVSFHPRTPFLVVAPLRHSPVGRSSSAHQSQPRHKGRMSRTTPPPNHRKAHSKPKTKRHSHISGQTATQNRHFAPSSILESWFCHH